MLQTEPEGDGKMREYRLFPTAHCEEYDIEELCGEIVYEYLFRGTGVKKIESLLFGEEEFHGYLAKTILNFYGIDTSPGNLNKGLYRGCGLLETAEDLLKSKDESRRKTGLLLMKKAKRTTEECCHPE